MKNLNRGVLVWSFLYCAISATWPTYKYNLELTLGFIPCIIMAFNPVEEVWAKHKSGLQKSFSNNCFKD